VRAAEPLYKAQLIFEPGSADRPKVHASCLVECPNGDLRAVWYENSPILPPPYTQEQTDKSDDVRIGGARRPAGATEWEAPFVMTDNYGIADDNPCMIVDAQQRLWVIHPILLGSPDWSWGSGLLQYQISTDYQKPGRPTWER